MLRSFLRWVSRYAYQDELEALKAEHNTALGHEMRRAREAMNRAASTLDRYSELADEYDDLVVDYNNLRKYKLPN
jgi:hypothetical protein